MKAELRTPGFATPGSCLSRREIKATSAFSQWKSRRDHRTNARLRRRASSKAESLNKTLTDVRVFSDYAGAVKAFCSLSQDPSKPRSWTSSGSFPQNSLVLAYSKFRQAIDLIRVAMQPFASNPASAGHPIFAGDGKISCSFAFQ